MPLPPLRILTVHPSLGALAPVDAAAQDQLSLIDNLMRRGHDIHWLTRCSPYRNMGEIEHFFAERKILATILPWQHKRLVRRRMANIAFWDGRSWDYSQSDFMSALKRLLDDWKPDLAICCTSFTWASAALAQSHGIPTIIRSQNDETGTIRPRTKYSVAGFLQHIGARFGELQAVRHADVLAAITPTEQRAYQRKNQRANVQLLPLCTLTSFLRPAVFHPKHAPLRVFFMAASYKSIHNASALQFMIREVVPAARKASPGAFEFHILGSKVPPEITQWAAPDLVFDGFVPDLEKHLAEMDIAVSPSIIGPGMQQKVFEPICRGFPTITHPRGLAGYPFEADVDVLLALDAAGFVQQLIRLQNPTLRQSIGQNAARKAAELFSQEQLDSFIDVILENALKR